MVRRNMLCQCCAWAFVRYADLYVVFLGSSFLDVLAGNCRRFRGERGEARGCRVESPWQYDMVAFLCSCGFFNSEVRKHVALHAKECPKGVGRPNILQ